MQCLTLGNMSVTSRIPNVVFLGLLISMSLYSDQGFFGVAEQIVDTEPHVVLEVGTTGILPCHIQRRAISVDWKRELSSGTELLVSLDPFFIVGERDGPGYEAGLFNITDDYSLVIKDVKVQDEGLYMCSFSDYQTGEPFSNSTRVSVQAFPDEPFPVIQECIGKDVNSGACTLTIYSTSDLTCLVRGYYPDIDLFFLHGSEKMTSTEDEEWFNADGTKNRDITIQISVSDEPYECVASRLPVIGGNRSVTVIVQARPETRSQGPNAVAIVVPVIVGICLSIAAIFIYHRRKKRGWWSRHGYISVALGNTSTHLKDLGGAISKLELWQLIKYAEENGDCEKLGKVIRRLLKNNTLTLQSNLGFYESLCTWKRETSSHSNQREILYSALNEVGMSDLIWKLLDVVKDSSRKVSRAILGHILREIKETSKITELLRSLQLNHQAVATAVEQGRREVEYRAHRELVEWRNGEFRINPLVILSLKLDDLECETNFFKIPSSEIEDIDECELRGRISKVICQHLTHLLKFYGDIHGEDQPYQIEKLVQENHESLFNTIQMLQDWVKNEECNNHKIRNKLRKAAKSSLERDHTADKWPPDDELRVIASFLSPKSMGPLSSKLGIRRPPRESSQEQRFQALAEWKDRHASSNDLLEKHTELITALKEVEREGLIPRVKDHLVYKAELVDLAFHLFAQDLLPFTEALGISSAKLPEFRPKFHPSHMTQGTLGLVCKLFGLGERSHFLEILKKMPYPKVSASAMLALDISFGELYAVSFDSPKQPRIEDCHNNSRSTIINNTCLKDGVNSLSSVSSLETSHTETERDNDVSIQKRSEYDIYEETTRGFTTMLASTVELKDQDLTPIESMVLGSCTLLRKQSCLSPFSSRLALAKALRIVGNESQAYALIRGDYDRGSIPFTFMYDILRNMTPDQLYKLHSLIRDTTSTPVEARLSADIFQEVGWFYITDKVCEKTRAWIEKWIKQWNSTQWEKGERDFLSTRDMAEKHREFNDKLVDLGFVDLAREIMISEQQVI